MHLLCTSSSVPTALFASLTLRRLALQLSAADLAFVSLAVHRVLELASLSVWAVSTSLIRVFASSAARSSLAVLARLDGEKLNGRRALGALGASVFVLVCQVNASVIVPSGPAPAAKDAFDLALMTAASLTSTGSGDVVTPLQQQISFSLAACQSPSSDPAVPRTIVGAAELVTETLSLAGRYTAQLS